MELEKRISCVVLCLMILSVALPIGSATAAQIETSRRGELSIEYLYDNEPVSGAEFQVYRVVEISEDGMYRLTGRFKDYPVEMNGLTDTEMANAALTLQGFAQRDQLAPDYTVITDENGTAKLTDLATGLYLIVGKPLVTEEGTYTTKPCLPADFHRR